MSAADLVVMVSPAFDNDPGRRQRVEDFVVERPAKLRVEAFAIAVFLLGGGGWLEQIKKTKLEPLEGTAPERNS